MSTKQPCLINQDACAREVGNPICPKCGMNDRGVYPGPDALDVALTAATAKYWRTHAQQLNDEAKAVAKAREEAESKAREQKKPNGFGLHDMHGNVREWVQDCYEDNYSQGQSNDGSAHRGNDSSCSRRVRRGGDWGHYPLNLGSARRTERSPDYRSDNGGFRLARTVP